MLGPTNDAGVRHNAGALPNDGLLHVMLASDMALGSDISSGALGTCCLVAILAQKSPHRFDQGRLGSERLSDTKRCESRGRRSVPRC